MRSIDKFRGCLIGGAAGDALGYEVEFLDTNSIHNRFGQSGITEYVLHNGVAQISDDTQMTLFTATGLLLGTTRGMTRGIIGSYPSYIACSYKEWLRTQQGTYPVENEYCYSWLANIRELYSRRAPGMTCLSAIEDGCEGQIEKPINNSKGCGGVMRVAPIGLYFTGKSLPIEEADRIGAEAAALTHGHELGYLPAAVLVHIIYRLADSSDISINDAVNEAVQTVERLYPNSSHMKYLRELIQKAQLLSQEKMNDLDAIRALGEGWVAEETLAIAIYCALKYPHDFDRAMIASVNHKGDSDSTGAVTGNILGAYLGMAGIPPKYTEHLELRDLILEVADDLYYDCKMTEYGSYFSKTWNDKYIEMTYRRSTETSETRKEERKHASSSLTIQKISITDLDVDCIVNAANNQLQQGGGVCGAIFAAAGAKKLQAICNDIGMCDTGHTVVTPGFNLKAKYIIHAVGPRWKDGKHHEEAMLYNCYKCAMADAQMRDCHSIAFPLISSGIYGYPAKEAWKVAIKAIQDYQKAHADYHLDVIIAVISDDSLRLGNSVLSGDSSNSNFVFFWHEYGENGHFSQWYPAPFVVEGIRYFHNEQYMMAKKALLFGDTRTYNKIMAESDPATCKALGKSAANFNQALWDSCKEEIIYNANYAKFSQNSNLKVALLATGEAIIAEASPYDKIWGIGLKASDPNAQTPSKWQGQNLLGKSLMRVRVELQRQT